MNIQWFPGHMAKTRRLIEENLKLVDIVIEIADARLVRSSRSPLLAELINKKPRILVMNKADIADRNVNAEWENYFKKNKISALFLNSLEGGKIPALISAAVTNELSDQIKKWEEKGLTGRRIRVMVTGVPNVGKSTFINALTGRRSAKTGDRPGVTTGKQWLKAGKFELLDTPGILAPKFESEETGEHLAFSGAISDAVFDRLEAVCILLEFLRDNYGVELCRRYKLEDIEEMSGYEILRTVCKNRGFIISGGELDEERGASVVLDEFRAAKIAKVSLERPPRNE